MGDYHHISDWILGHKQIIPFRNAIPTERGYEPCSIGQFVDHGITDVWYQNSDAINWNCTSLSSMIIKDVPRCGSGSFFKRPYQTAVVGQGTPAALPYRFSGEHGKRNCAAHKLSFRFNSIYDGKDQMKEHVLKCTHGEQGQGRMLPSKDLSAKCFMERGLVNLDTLAFEQMNHDRDTTMGMACQMWHSVDTQEGIFKLSPKEKHVQISLNGVNNTPTYQFYQIHLSFFTKGNCKREHPLSFLDYDCTPFNKVFKEIVIKWKSNNSAGEQLVWKYHQDPEMDVFYSFFVSYYENFWPESEIPSYEEWMTKPVIIFSPNTRAGRPVRKFSSFNTGGITLDATYRDGLTVDDVYSLFGEDYNWAFDPVLRPTFADILDAANANLHHDFKKIKDYTSMFRTYAAVDTYAGQFLTPTATNILGPNGKEEMHPQAAFAMAFDDLVQMLSLLAFRVVMSNTQILWFAGVGLGGAVPCTIFVRSGGTGPAPGIVAAK